eukprot:4468357-Amphidinium_carterae.1
MVWVQNVSDKALLLSEPGDKAESTCGPDKAGGGNLCDTFKRLSGCRHANISLVDGCLLCG